MTSRAIMVASLGVGVSVAVNGQKHILDPGLQPSTTLYDFLRGRTTCTVSVSDHEAVDIPVRASIMPRLNVSMSLQVLPFVTLLSLHHMYGLCDFPGHQEWLWRGWMWFLQRGGLPVQPFLG